MLAVRKCYKNPFEVLSEKTNNQIKMPQRLTVLPSVAKLDKENA